MTPLIWAILLLLLGVTLVLLELFVPSGGVLGVLAALAILGAIGVGFWSSVTEGLIMLVAAAVITPATVGFGLKVWPHTPMGRAILNRHAIENDPLPEDGREQLIGRVGLAKSKMLPSGAINVDGKVYNAVSTGMAIESGQPIRVVRISGNSIIVQPHEGPINPADASADAVMEQSLESLGLDPFDEESA